jgi:hypothetical protein
MVAVVALGEGAALDANEGLSVSSAVATVETAETATTRRNMLNHRAVLVEDEADKCHITS